MKEKPAFEKLRELLGISQDLACRILDTIPAGLSITTDLSCKKILHNRKAAEFLRIDPWEEHSFSANTSHPAKLLYEGKEIAPEEMPMQRALWQGETTQDLELEIIWEDGEHRFGQINASPIYDDVGKIIGALVITEDITERKCREANRCFLDEINKDFTRFSTEEEIIQAVGARLGTYLNLTSCFLAEIEESQNTAIVSYFWKEQQQPDIAGVYSLSKLVSDEFLRALRSGEAVITWNMESDLRINVECLEALNVFAGITVPFYRHGKLKYLFTAFSSTPRDWRKKEIEIFCELANRTFPRLERARAEEGLKKAHDELEQKVKERTKELKRKEEYLRGILESQRDLIVRVDLKHRFNYVNDAYCKTFGKKREELIGQSFTPFVHEEDLEETLKAMEQLFVPPYRAYMEQRAMTVNGWRWIAWEDSGILNEQGEVVEIQGVGRDITDRKKMEEEIQRADKLESVGILAGGIAHDFNNYLATLQGNISLAKLYRSNPHKISEKLEKMEKATMRAKNLSNQLFTFAKGGAPVKEKISIKELIFEEVKFALSGSQVRPRFSIKNDLQMVEADKGQLSQVLSNIALNAVQAMPGGGTLEIRAENVHIDEASLDSLKLPEGSYIKIAIQDEGIGIPEKYLSKIFDPFFTTKDSGRGLGLATAYSIVKNHGGFLQVESEMGVGTTFFIFIPALIAVEESLDISDDVVEGKGKILVMEDEEELLVIAEEALSALGYEVATARDGEEAADLYMNHLEKGKPFDLVIMDLTIPAGMGGKETIQEIMKKDPEVKAVVASGYSNDPVMANYRDYGFKGMLKKPFTIEELSKLVYEII